MTVYRKNDDILEVVNTKEDVQVYKIEDLKAEKERYENRILAIDVLLAEGVKLGIKDVL